ncbi:uncharacterized protein LOC131847975 [Achroia grisella]|uniref:uncharacterized protein LOC131847975 n=1 Tax=Achroia grisella TaxID=688607 RepID=UPI0027D1EAA9|nr:uncharacterized protein LOC131847975 [Achroia grisella]
MTVICVIFQLTAEYIHIAGRRSKLVIYNEYTFSKRAPLRNGIRYACSCALSKRCKAYVHVSQDDIVIKAYTDHNHEPIKYAKTPNGYYVNILRFPHYIEIAGRGSKLLMYEEYTYFRSGRVRDGGSRFTCSGYGSKGCKAHIHISKTAYVRSAKGSILLLLHNYTYSKNGFIRDGGLRYACSQMAKHCKAYVHVSKLNQIVKADLVHNHEPPSYLLTKEGYYVRTS